MNLLGKLFNKKRVLKASNVLKIAIINDNTEELYEAFGITDARRDVLVNVCKKTYNETDRMSDSFEKIVNECKHVNEVVVCCILFERMRAQSSFDMSGLFSKMFDHE